MEQLVFLYGGFYKHHEQNSYYSYHSPGFKENDKYDGINVVKLIREAAFAIKRKSVPLLHAPDAPTLFGNIKFKAINWRGLTGANRYDIARAENKEGPRIVIGHDVSDCKQVETEGSLFGDDSAQYGRHYYYKVKAKNSVGESNLSNVVGPISS